MPDESNQSFPPPPARPPAPAAPPSTPPFPQAPFYPAYPQRKLRPAWFWPLIILGTIAILSVLFWL